MIRLFKSLPLLAAVVFMVVIMGMIEPGGPLVDQEVVGDKAIWRQIPVEYKGKRGFIWRGQVPERTWDVEAFIGRGSIFRIDENQLIITQYWSHKREWDTEGMIR